MEVKSRREEYALLTRTAIQDAAAKLFAEQGYSATSVDDVARAARVSKGAVYHHFSDKQRMFAEAFRASQQAVMDAVGQAFGRTEDPWEQAFAGLDAYLDSYVTDPAWRSLLQQAQSALGHDLCRQINEEVALPVLRAALDALAAAGELAPVSVELTAWLLFSALCEAANVVAVADDPLAVRDDARLVLHQLVGGLRGT